jgi:beta-lactamase regulating signal transducer with metallopeptidase domain
MASRDWIPRRLEGELVFISENEGPAEFGLFRPRIVVPRWLLHADSQTRVAAITHEREHIKRGDALLSLFGLVLVATMPWNLPLMWQLKRLRLAIEVDCDTRVVCGRRPLDGIAYADALVRIWRRNYPKTAMTELSSDMRHRIVILQAWSTRNN